MTSYQSQLQRCGIVQAYELQNKSKTLKKTDRFKMIREKTSKTKTM